MTMLLDLSQRTCAEQCWNAREDVCRCTCHGANHGCLLINGRPAPGRTKRTGDTRWRLHAVADHSTACFVLERYLVGDHWALQAIPKDCKWPEAQGADCWGSLVWVRSDVPEEQADAEVQKAHAEARADHMAYHLRECDGVTDSYQHPRIAHPCTEPEFHQPQ